MRVSLSDLDLDDNETSDFEKSDQENESSTVSYLEEGKSRNFSLTSSATSLSDVAIELDNFGKPPLSQLTAGRLFCVVLFFLAATCFVLVVFLPVEFLNTYIEPWSNTFGNKSP